MQTTGHAHDGTVGGGAPITALTNATITTSTIATPTITNGTISGTTINSAVIGGTTPAAATFTTINLTDAGTTPTMTYGLAYDATNHYINEWFNGSKVGQWNANGINANIGATTPLTGIFGALSCTSGTINGASVGATTPSTGAFTSLTATGFTSTTSNTIVGGTIDNTIIGGTTSAAGSFTTLNASTSIGCSGALTVSGLSNVSLSPGGAASVTISPSGGGVNISPGGTLTLASGTLGALTNVTIGSSSPASGTFTTLTGNSLSIAGGSTPTTGLYLNSGVLTVRANGGNVLGFTGGASSLNTVSIASGATGIDAAISFQGQATCGGTIYTSGTGNLNFYTNNTAAHALQIINVNSAANFITITPSVSGSPTISTNAGDLTLNSSSGNLIGNTPSTADNSTKLATTAYVQNNLTNFAALSGPTFTGVPKAPTASLNTSTTQIATTAFANPSSSIGTAGFVELPSGLVIQWGTTGSIAPGSNTSPTFSTAFPTACFGVSVSNATPSGNQALNVSAKSTTGFTVQNPGTSSGNTAGFWVAYGN